MKKTGFKLFAVSLALCFFFGACNFNINGGRELAEVRVGGGGGRAANPETGLPIFDGSNTTITISDASGRLIAEGPLPLSAEVVVGVEIVVKATVRTASGTWSKTKTHTVKAGINDIDLELSKTPNVAANLLVSITGKHHSGSNIVSLSTQNGKKLLDGILIGKKPVTARDKIGRIYVLYEEPSVHIKRFDVEGNEDTGFETNLTAALPSGVTIDDIDNIAIRQDDNYIFLFKKNTVYCFKEKEDHSFESFESDVFPSLPVPVPSSSAVAVYDDVMLAVYNNNNNTLFACKFKFEDASGHSGAKRLKFESQATRKPLAKLRTGSVFGNNLTECTGLFADKSGVYCLLKEQGLHHGKLYALGQLVHYTYSGSTLTKKGETGLNPAASTGDPIAFNAQYFSNPVGFIGYDEENIYIADDGVNIGYINENLHINGNQDRIAAFNRKTNTIAFNDTGATWYAEHSEYKFPNTKILLWGKDPTLKLQYWIGSDGQKPFSTTNKVFTAGSTEEPIDVFCYDQDGNLYILWKDSSGYGVKRFALQENGTYDTAELNISLTTFPVSAIAVDISDGQNILYYAYADGPAGHIQKYSWNLGSLFSTASSVSEYDLSFEANNAPVTALAANKDGLFVASKNQSSSIAPYTLKVQRYKKDTVAEDGHIVIVNNVEAFDPHNANAPYNTYDETVYDLQIVNGVLYAITSKLEQKKVYITGYGYGTDEFKSRGILYKIAETASFSGNATKIGEKSPVPPEGTNPGVGYGFYRFIAVKPKELVIASDGACAVDGNASGSSGNPAHSDNKVLTYDLDGNLQKEENAGGQFSKELNPGSGFNWE